MDHYGVARFGDQVHVEIVVPESSASGGAGGSGGEGGSVGGTGGGWGASSGAGGESGSSGSGQGTSVIKQEQGGGCGCRVGGDRSSRTGLAAALALAGLAFFRRRR
jgi:MYXO-CTERM domain-containing protein